MHHFPYNGLMDALRRQDAMMTNSGGSAWRIIEIALSSGTDYGYRTM